MLLQDLTPLPEQPGVYLWKKGEEIIYVGKAKSLRSRVTSYFHSEGKSLRVSEESDKLEFIVVRDEVEALLLEANLIKRHRPHYNVMLKDDKHYPFLKLTNEEFPMLMVVRRVLDDGARYWGPFPDAGAIHRIKRLVDRNFPLRKNSGFPMRKRRHPCLNFSIGRCFAPCVGGVDPEKYQVVAKQVEALLDGNVDELYESLNEMMQAAAKTQDFERAAEIRDQISSVQRFFGTSQQAYDSDLGDLDFLGFSRAGNYVSLQLYQMRRGQILGRVAHFSEGVAEDTDQELLSAFVRDYYLEATPLPPLVLLPFELEEQAAMGVFLSSKGRKVEVRTPQRGDKTRLVELAQKNSQTALETELKIRERKGDHPGLKGLMEILGLGSRPFRIEGYDISNLQGEAIVGSVTVFEGGKPKKGEYRRMRITGLANPDDYFSMEQTIYRRFTGSLSNTMAVPELILIDGGIGQVRAAKKGLDRAGIQIPLVGLAKREETLILENGKSIQLDPTHPAMQLLIFQRDETHNNGLNYNRTLRSRKALKSIFDDIPGIGPQRKMALLQNFSTLEELRAMTLDQLSNIPGIDRKSAKAVLEAVNRSQETPL